MIVHDDKRALFHVKGRTTSYVMQVLPSGQVVNLHWGAALGDGLEPANLRDQAIVGYGNTTVCDPSQPGLSLDLECLEASPWGRGDYRRPSLLVETVDGDRGSDFRYAGHRMVAGAPAVPGLPSPHAQSGAAETLEIDLDDAALGLRLTLVYTMFPDCDVLCRSCRLENRGAKPVRIHDIASCIVDLEPAELCLTTLNGAWIREHHPHRAPLRPGIQEVSSIRGASGSSHDPFLMLEEPAGTEDRGECRGFVLMYSGNHACRVEVNPHGLIRVRLGINPVGFNWLLGPGETFATPVAALGYSTEGRGGLSRNLHRFVRGHVVRGPWAHRPRPVLINSWEASYFKFNESSLVGQAKAAKAVGVELFVMDDGWFGKRNDDTSSLGDWFPNKAKLPGGLERLARRITGLGLDFGLWMEPEMISKDSDLYRAHPDWLVRSPGNEPAPGRNQFFLDLTRQDVRDYLVETINGVLASAKISYVKWDMNRNMSDWYSAWLGAERQGEFIHRYFLGLYDILGRITAAHPDVLFESCAAGGNRSDWGMLCYMPQVWASDNSDAVERLSIQHGASLCMPPSVVGAHVSAVPNHQVMRNTPIESRFNTAAFGLLGYELDLRRLSPVERKIIRHQIAWYKEWRELLQFGEFHRILDPSTGNEAAWMAVAPDRSKAVLGWYLKMAKPNQLAPRLRLAGLDPAARYAIANRTQYVELRQYGDLVNQMLPVRIKINGVLHNVLADNYLAAQESTRLDAPADQLMRKGFLLKRPFYGAGNAENVALVGDYGSRLFTLVRVEAGHES